MNQRNTVQRGLVFSAMEQLPKHPTAEDVYLFIHEQHPGVSKATVYRNLNVLCKMGDLFRLSLPSGADRFDLAKNAHYHVKCIHCGRVEDVDIPYLSALQNEVASATGYELNTYQMVFEGSCPDCQKKGKNGLKSPEK